MWCVLWGYWSKLWMYLSCGSLHSQKGLYKFAFNSKSKQKNIQRQYRKFGNTGLIGARHIASRNDFPKLNTIPYHFMQKWLKQQYLNLIPPSWSLTWTNSTKCLGYWFFFWNGRSYQQNWKGEPNHFNLVCVIMLLIKILTVVGTATQFCIWTR